MVKIETGDTVKFRAQGRTFEGKVLTADNNGNKYGWYIEMIDNNDGYVYWKQGHDGGELLEVNGQPV